MIAKILYGALVITLIALGSTTTAQAFELSEDFDEPCTGGMGILAAICGTVNDLHDFIHGQEARTDSLNATQILQQVQIDDLEGNVTSLDSRISSNDVDITNLQNTDGEIQGNVTSLSSLVAEHHFEGDVTNLQTNISDLQGNLTNAKNNIITLQGTVTTHAILIADRYIVESTHIVPSFLNVNTLVSCEAGDTAMAGGWNLPIDSLLTGANHSQETNGFEGWKFSINNDDPVNDHPITFKVVCIDHTP